MPPIFGIVSFIIYQKIALDAAVVVELRQIISSYLGHFKHAQSHRLVKALFEKHAWLNIVFRYENGRIHERYVPKNEFRSLRAQIRFFRYQLESMVVFCTMGKFIEIYDDDAKIIHNVFGGELKKGFRGMKMALGFPVATKSAYIHKALANGYSVAILEEGSQGRWIKHRYVSMVSWMLGSVPEFG